MTVTFAGYNVQVRSTTPYGTSYPERLHSTSECNFSVDNTLALLLLLDLVEDKRNPQNSLAGEMPLAEFEVACDLAETFFQDEAVKFIRDTRKGSNFLDFGLSEGDLRKKFIRLRSSVADLKIMGATHICWD